VLSGDSDSGVPVRRIGRECFHRECLHGRKHRMWRRSKSSAIREHCLRCE
jgi:hypothetical protein